MSDKTTARCASLLSVVVLVTASHVRAQSIRSFATLTGGEWPMSAAYYAGKRLLFSPTPDMKALRWCIAEGMNCEWRTLDDRPENDSRAFAYTPVASVVFRGRLHIFYQEANCDPNFCVDMNLREAVFDGHEWSRGTLDGDGGDSGRTTNLVGVSAAATVWNDRIWVIYNDKTLNDKRLATLDVDWTFQNLDGSGGNGGRVVADLDGFSAIVGTSHGLEFFYGDWTHGGLRRAVVDATDSWTMSILDPLFASGNAIAAAHLGDVTHLFYVDASSHLRHAWDAGGVWSMQTHDGVAGPNGRIDSFVNSPIATTAGDQLHVFYTSYDSDVPNTGLRHSWAPNYQPWNFETADGYSTIDGRVEGNFAGLQTLLAPQGSLLVYYLERTTSEVRIASDQSASSCRDQCGGPSLGGVCWCDASCASFGDCCADYGEYCGPARSCQGRCGQSAESGDCWCDVACIEYGDCCSDYLDRCPA